MHDRVVWPEVRVSARHIGGRADQSQWQPGTAPRQVFCHWYRQHDRNVTSRLGRVAFYTLMVRERAWLASVDEPERRRELVRVWRRLTLRWAVATLRSERTNSTRRDAVRAASVFARLCVVGHPEPADERTADLLARYVLDPRPVAA